MNPPLGVFLKESAAKLGRQLLDLVFPRSCVHCRGRVDAESPLRHLCKACATRITVIKPPRCTTCGYPFAGLLNETLDTRLCPHCAGLEPAFSEGRTCVLLRGAARSLVHTLKYHNGLYVIEDIQRLFANSPDLAQWLHATILIPVPLHSRRERKRGYNQSELLAQALLKIADSKKTRAGDAPKIENLLCRIKNTRSQTGYDKRTRLKNLTGAFALKKRAKLSPETRYILVDDVFTTGATLNSCAKVLRRAGARKIDIIAFGHG